ncbi:MAG TPA: hypothetical protein VFN90_04605 [Gemmatimonadales bacterium]|nr:hypothetical protein [Gemmatimonadales bacterium]
MGKRLAGIVAGYVTMMVMVFGLMTLGWVAVGADGAFEPGVFVTTPLWHAISIGVAVVAALAGGRVARRLGGDRETVVGLAILVFVLGVVFAIPVLTADPTLAATPRPDGLAMMDAVNQAQQPVWVALANPVIGAIGAMLGGRDRAASA